MPAPGGGGAREGSTACWRTDPAGSRHPAAGTGSGVARAGHAGSPRPAGVDEIIAALGAQQQLLVRACCAADPVAFLAAQLARADLPLDAPGRAMLAALDADGLRLTRLLVHKLRFERLLRGDAAVRAAFAADPAAVTARFGDYAGAVPPTAVFPAEEAALFAAWSARGAA
jgi:hypothetical protein